MRCPRRDEGHGYSNKDPNADAWRPDCTCPWCGSLSPDRLFEAIAAGYELGPTDKDYKVYVMVPNPLAGKIVEVGSRSGPSDTLEDATPEELAAGHFRRPIMGEASSHSQMKFYFPHLSREEMHRFIDLLNAKKINIGYPGHFYRRPFFIAHPGP